MNFIYYIGPMRIALALFTWLLIIMAPFAKEADFSGWGITVGTIAPALMVIMLFVLSLDILMSRIFMTDVEGAERIRYRRIIWLQLFLLFILLLSWGPFLVNLLQQR
jgi:hypothetical protein